MKKVIAILITLVMLMFCGCAQTNVEFEQTTETSMFVVVEQEALWYVVYHRETKVMYAISRGVYNTGTFCPLVNQDGTPMLWKGGVR